MNGCNSLEPNLLPISLKKIVYYRVISVNRSFSCESMWPVRMKSTSFFNFLSEGKKRSLNILMDKNVISIVFRSVWMYLYCSCVSRSIFFSSSILSVVNLRTMTSSMVSTTSPFSPRLRLEQRQHFHIYKVTKTNKQTKHPTIKSMRCLCNTDLGASVASSSSEYWEAQCLKKKNRPKKLLSLQIDFLYITKQSRQKNNRKKHVDLLFFSPSVKTSQGDAQALRKALWPDLQTPWKTSRKVS